MSSQPLESDETLIAKPHPARVYDYLLGGFHNFDVDRRAAEYAKSIYPDLPLGAQANRAFLRRVVLACMAQGIDQFLDIGSGIPSHGTVHEIAQRINPAARVVYVDTDLLAMHLSRDAVRGNHRTAVIQLDVRQAGELLAHPAMRLLDFRRPIGLLMLFVLHFIPNDAEAYRCTSTLMGALAAGSHLAISHATRDDTPPEVIRQLEAMSRAMPLRQCFRSRVQLARFFEGFSMLQPGLVHVPAWRPETPDDLFVNQPARALALAGVACKA